MKILKFTAENVKKLTVVEICPDGNVVQITGRNGQGKTSVLDALWWVFTGTANIQSQPIRHGAEMARIEVQLGNEAVELVVERRFTEANSYLAVKTADGAKYPNPKRFMDDLLGSLTMDPLAFMRQPAKAQFDTLRGLVTLDIDPDALDAANKVDFESRTALNRDAKAKRAQAAAIIVPEDLPAVAVDETALLDQITLAADANADIERRRANRANAAKKMESDRLAIAAKLEEAARITGEADAMQAACDKLEADIATAGPLPEPVDISAVRAELEAAKVVNAGIAARERQQTINAEIVSLEGAAEKLTAAMEGRTAEKLAAIAKADMPVPGLGFGDGIVTFNGLPLDQASDAEQLTVSMSIAAAFNPKLRVLRIRDGSLLDDSAMKRLATFADERDMQIWVEMVTNGQDVGFVLEDGHIRGQEPAADTAASATKKAARKQVAA